MDFQVRCATYAYDLLCAQYLTQSSLSLAGQYGVLVPFYNADFNGKIARFNAFKNISDNLQELDVTVDRFRPGLYRGFRGGFASIWQGVDF